MTTRTIDLLLVEDNPGDARLTREAFAESQPSKRFHVVTDGLEALAFLRRSGAYRDAPRPDLILLDLNLPRMDGREVLAVIKQDDELKQIPVVVLSTSDASVDVEDAYRLHANCYVTKPVDLADFQRVVRQTDGFWFATVQLPSR